MTEYNSLIEQIKKIAEKLFDGANESHDWEHTIRVARLCQRIGKEENADMVVLMIAAYLHDIGRCYQDSSNGAVCHAKKGAEMAQLIISNLSLSPDRKKNIIHCVEAHRFRGNIPAGTKEAKVLFDADKLDAIGAIGIARAFLFAGEVGAKLHNPDINIEETKPYSKEDTGYREYKIKLSKLKERMLTDTGKQMAITRHSFMELFFNQFVMEHEGKR